MATNVMCFSMKKKTSGDCCSLLYHIAVDFVAKSVKYQNRKLCYKNIKNSISRMQIIHKVTFFSISKDYADLHGICSS